MIEGLAASVGGGGGTQSLDLGAGPSQSGDISSGGFSFGGPVINPKSWGAKEIAVVGAVALGLFWLSKKK